MILVKLLRNMRYEIKPCKNAQRNYSEATTGRVSAKVLHYSFHLHVTVEFE